MAEHDTRQALPPLPEAAHNPRGWSYTAEQMQAYARAALAVHPVAGAVATDETGWLIEHSGEILPGAERRAQVGWLRVRMKFNGYGAREFGFTHDANEALRFSRREDAEAVLAMHLGASPPDWYSKPFSVTEHMWPAAPQPQAAPAPEPSAQGEPVACDRDAPVCPWCDRQGWDICQHADDARTCGK